jgi:S1-C subfamily serine protease
MLKKIIIIFGIVLISGLSAVFAEHWVFPQLAATRFFQEHDFLKETAENITMINKTEQVFVKEESSIVKLAGPSVSSVVKVVSFPNSQTRPDQKISHKNGTGLIVTSDGLVMTHSSAINASGSTYKVLTYDGGSYDAELKSIDSWSGLVFLKISASNLAAVSFGSSNDTKAGEKVLTIGRSFSQSGLSYASGVISDVDPTFNLAGKTLSSSEKLEGVFRTDMILDGNFLGGPLVDYSGQVIGVNGSLEFDGKVLFFQIPSEKVKLAVGRFIAGETEKNSVLGIYYVPLTQEYALAHNIPRQKGALVFSPSGQSGLAIISGSAAEKAGLHLGDIITHVGTEEVSLEKSFSDLIYKYKKGEEMELTLFRGEEELKIKVRL